ncbi:MAG: PhzF family phenazine biosynthesis protein [Pyrinomonadaceae bacterium]|nr:PhzF family phenazine biosynthesis protein [Pyrinomonadaceae bacterium]
MGSLKFFQLDVFTNTPFAGNPLAVFPECGELESEKMQVIAREMNLSETVFVQGSEKALRKLRIFTPKQELPLAGHPVVGTWNLLAQLGIVSVDGKSVTVEQELLAGVLPVDIEFENGKPTIVTMTQAKFEPGKIAADRGVIKDLAAALGILESDICADADLPVQAVSTGIYSLAVPVRSLDALSTCRINSSLLAEVYLAYGAIGCYPFTFETKEKSSKVHARFFAPDDGIPEDPATGSAAGALAGYLIHHGAIEPESDGHARFTIEQGDFMGRPSRIFAEVKGAKGNIEKVRIGGRSCLVATGEVFV